MSSLLYPLVTFVLLVVCVAYWGTTAMYPSILCVHVCAFTTCFHTKITNISEVTQPPVTCSVSFHRYVHSLDSLTDVCRYLATSGVPVYKVVSLGNDTNVNGTVDCDPQVKILTVILPGPHCNFVWISLLETQNITFTHIISIHLLPSELQLLSLSRLRLSHLYVHQIQWWGSPAGEPVQPADLQRCGVSLVRQLCHRPGAVYARRGLCLLLLGLHQT